MEKVDSLYKMANKLAQNIDQFFEVLDPGHGNDVVNQFMADLRQEAEERFGEDFSEISVTNRDDNLRVDYYFPKEKAVIEIALGLHNPNNEFWKDVCKCLLGRENGKNINTLVFFSRPGGEERMNTPAFVSMCEYAQKELNLKIDARNLENLN